MNPAPPPKRGRLRRTVRGIGDTMAMGGTARMGTGGLERTGHTLQSRFVADSALGTTRDDDDQSEGARALWSVGGAVALALLGLATVGAGMRTTDLLTILLGVADLVAAAAVVVPVVRRATQHSAVHLVGIFLAAVSLYAHVFVYRVEDAELFGLMAILLAIGAIVGLVVGRR